MPSTAEEQASRAENHHQSTVDTLLGCPRKWALEYVAGLEPGANVHALAGTVFHSMMEIHESARIAGLDAPALDDLYTRADQEVQDLKLAQATLDKVKAVEVPRIGKVTGREALRWQVRHALEAFYLSRQLEGNLTPREWLLKRTPIAAERFMKAEVVEGCKSMAGTTDLILEDTDGSLMLLDFKTSNRLGDFNKPEGKMDQATFYAVLAMTDENLSDLESKLLPAKTLPKFTYLVVSREKGKTARKKRTALLTVQPEGSDVAAMGVRIRKAEATIDEEMFLPNPEYTFCRMCPFWDRCQGTGELAGEWGAVKELLAAERN